MARDLGMWRDGARRDVVYVQRVDPHDLGRVDGVLGGLVLDGCSITEGYYTDARVQASIRHDGEWGEDLHWLRVVHECPAYGYRAELGTFVVDSISHDRSRGGVTCDLTCQSVLWALADDSVAYSYVIGSGATTSKAFQQIMRTTGKEGQVLPGAAEHRYGAAVAYDAGDGFQKMLFDVATTAGDRLSVDGHGRITLGPYVSPSKRDPDWVLDARERRTIVLSDGGTETISLGDAAGRSMVKYSRGEGSDIAASWDVGQGSLASPSRRGWNRTEVHSVNDLSPQTHAAAETLARRYVGEDSEVAREVSVKCLYFPVHQGDVVSYTDAQGHEGKYLAKDVKASLGDMTVELTLKGV